jgi:hypothetical protein
VDGTPEGVLEHRENPRARHPSGLRAEGAEVDVYLVEEQGGEEVPVAGVERPGEVGAHLPDVLAVEQGLPVVGHSVLLDQNRIYVSGNNRRFTITL